MPAISKIRFTNVVYEDGQKRYNDDLFRFEGHNGAIVLENGGGKTVFIQTLLQAIIPHTNLGERKIRDTLKLDGGPAHIAVEWLLKEKPHRRYVVTAVTLYLDDEQVKSLRYVYEYSPNDPHGIEGLPFVRNEGTRAAERYEMQEYYTQRTQSPQSPFAKTFDQIGTYRSFLEEQYHIIADEWNSIVKINQDEGGIEKFFDNCKLDKHLFDRLLIPTVETSIAGFDEQGFANTFEEQQKSFKLYKELRAQIAEYEAIEEELTAFVKANEELAQTEQTYVDHKSLVKGIYKVALKQEEQTKQKQEHIDESLKKLAERKIIQTAKREAYQIALQKEELSKEIELLEELRSDHERRQFLFNEVEKQLHSLQFAKQRAIVKEQGGLCTHFEEELTNLDKESDLVDLADQLDVVQGELNGYFIQQEEKFEKEKRGCEIELGPLKEALFTCEENEKILFAEKLELVKRLTETNAHIDGHEQAMQTIKRKILANPNEESIPALLPQWISTEARLDEQTIVLQNETKKLSEQGKIKKEEAEQLQKNIEKDAIDLSTLQQEIERMAAAHDLQLQRLSQLSFTFSRIDSLYLTQASTEQDLLRKVDHLQSEKEEKLLLERLAYRFIDDYGKQDIFFADPFLAQQLRNWTNQLGLVETGVRYVSELGVSTEEQLARYPYWAVTLITTEEKRSALIERVRSVAQKLTHPIHVIDLQEAKELVAGRGISTRQAILPEHWLHNMHIDQFATWKETLEAEAKRVNGERLAVEEQLQHWQSALQFLRQFYKQYPYEKVKETEEQERLLNNRLRLDRDNLLKLKRSIVVDEQQIDGNRQQIEQLKEEHAFLSQKIEAGRQYEIEAKKIKELTVVVEGLNVEQDALKTKLKRVARRKQNLNDERLLIEEKISSLNFNLALLQRDSHYRTVRDKSPIFTEVSLEVLKQREETIRFKLNKLSTTRRELENKLSYTKQRVVEAEQIMQQLRLRGLDIEEELDFPENGDWQLAQYSERERLERDQLNRTYHTFNAQDKQVYAVQAKVNDLVKQYEGRYPTIELAIFADALPVVEDVLKEEEASLKKEEQQLFFASEREERERANITEALQELNKFDEADHFTADFIEVRHLTEALENEFTYNRLQVVHQVTAELRQARTAVDNEQNRVASKRHAFHDYVRRHMSDAKMRDNLFQGLVHKQTYHELVEFQQNIRAKMNSIIRVNEESIREHDERLEQFITHMHEHAKSVIRELQMIPPKTRLKFATGSKQVFTFRIPEWEEKDGHMRLRAYIDEILSWIEHERYLDQDGKVNTNQVRADVEKWFATPQLLRIILQNGEMKVSCRKVTNDNEVTSKSYSWRESNEWSGGEKWSKNMTLFLGLLNYVAEKKQLLDTSMKRHRAVVLDNPFGKASSEHVLSPVFFIAERLGFQIIALTAHAEGKFLRDYFPVIYSCRLRPAANTSKQIMTKVKTINHAYFQDNEPKDLDRLGDSEQLSLL